MTAKYNTTVTAMVHRSSSLIGTMTRSLHGLTMDTAIFIRAGQSGSLQNTDISSLPEREVSCRI